MSKYLGSKAAFYRTYGFNKVEGSLVGAYPKISKNAENYKRSSVFFKSLLRELKPIKSGTTLYRGLPPHEARALTTSGVIEKKTFASFTTDVKIALRLIANSIYKSKNTTAPLVVMSVNVSNNTPTRGVVYNGIRYKSMFPTEKEILLPPGTFTFSRKPNHVRVEKKKDVVVIFITVTFTPSPSPNNGVNATNNEKKAPRAQNKVSDAHWKISMIKSLVNQLNRLRNTKAKVPQKFHNRINRSIQNTKRRIEYRARTLPQPAIFRNDTSTLAELARRNLIRYRNMYGDQNAKF